MSVRLRDWTKTTCLLPTCRRVVSWRPTAYKQQLFCDPRHAATFRLHRKRLLDRLDRLDEELSKEDADDRRARLISDRRMTAWKLLAYRAVEDPRLRSDLGQPED